MIAPIRQLCRHCGFRFANRPRQLCWHDYYTPGVREQYGPISIYGQRGIRDRYGSFPLPTEPTAALPGTVEKVAVLEERALSGLSLWHPDDATESIS